MRTDNAAATKGPVGERPAAPEEGHARPSAGVRRALVIFNRNAGGGRRIERFEAVVAQLRAVGVEVAVHETGFAGDAEQTAAAAVTASPRPDVLICAGGDGTINEVVNGLAGGDLPLALLPIGTANVLAAEIGLETDPESVVASILSGARTQVHLGTANGRYFTLMAGVGLDAEVVATVDLKLKRKTGKLAYALATLKRWAAYRGHRYRVLVDGTEYEAASAIVANGHYYAGKFVCAENARITEPGLHVCLFEKPGRWQAVYYMMALFGGFLDRLNTYRVIPARAVSIDVGHDGPVQGDGDIIAKLPVDVAVAASTVVLVMPPAPV